ncbi:Gfo/Idh/MocA family protein [Bacteroidota bacterium]
MYNWGIIGAGNIAGQFADDLKLLTRANLLAVASRSEERADKFAREHKIPKSYGNWENMPADPDIDIVYIATHHPFHFENALACLKSGKAVLCEKPFTMNKRELLELVSTARRKNIFLMEAIWTRFLPSMRKVLEISESGELGKLTDVYADFGFRLEFNPEHRLFNHDLGGGVLLDVGLYPVFISLLLAGVPRNIKANARFTKTGIDHSCNMIFEQGKDVVSSLNCTLMAEAPSEANLLFEKGRISMESWWLTPGPITVHRLGKEPELINFSESGIGYHYEADEVMRCLDEGLVESPMLPLDFSLDLIGTLDMIRSICGISYAQDEIK